MISSILLALLYSYFLFFCSHNNLSYQSPFVDNKNFGPPLKLFLTFLPFAFREVQKIAS